MTQEHPITPPPELVRKWLEEFHAPCTGLVPGEAALYLTAAAARWGADMELEACCSWVSVHCSRWSDGTRPRDELYVARRPKPPSLKELALEALSRMDQLPTTEDQSIIRRAIEELPD